MRFSNISLLLPVAMVAVVLVILDCFLFVFDITTITKLLFVGIFLFWTDGQEDVEFFELPGDAWAGLLFISHIEVGSGTHSVCLLA
jgi:hypothetical protein